MSSQLDSALLTTTAVTAAVATSYANLSVQYLGVPLNALAMAALGAAMSYAWGVGEPSRKKLFFVTLSSTIFGASCVTVVPELFGFTIRPIAQPPLAFIFSLFARWIIPALKGALPAAAQALAGMLNRGGSSYPNPYDQNPRKKDEDDTDPPSGGY